MDISLRPTSLKRKNWPDISTDRERDHITFYNRIIEQLSGGGAAVCIVYESKIGKQDVFFHPSQNTAPRGFGIVTRESSSSSKCGLLPR